MFQIIIKGIGFSIRRQYRSISEAHDNYMMVRELLDNLAIDFCVVSDPSQAIFYLNDYEAIKLNNMKPVNK